jgi:hypothetical protein
VKAPAKAGSMTVTLTGTSWLDAMVKATGTAATTASK